MPNGVHVTINAFNRMRAAFSERIVGHWALALAWTDEAHHCRWEMVLNHTPRVENNSVRLQQQ